MAIKKIYDNMDYMPNEFNVLDNSLGDLACNAGITIDCYIKDIHSELLRDDRYTIRLGKIMYIETETRVTKYNQNYIGIRDNVMVSLFLFELIEKINGIKLKRIEDLFVPTKKIALDLIKAKELNKDNQIILRDKCLEISRLAMNYWHRYNTIVKKRYCG
jgi:hypothetical protein